MLLSLVQFPVSKEVLEETLSKCIKLHQSLRNHSFPTLVRDYLLKPSFISMSKVKRLIHTSGKKNVLLICFPPPTNIIYIYWFLFGVFITLGFNSTTKFDHFLHAQLTGFYIVLFHTKVANFLSVQHCMFVLFIITCFNKTQLNNA